MSSAVRSVIGAAVLLTGTSAAMAASETTPAENQYIQTNASTAQVEANSTPTQNQSRKVNHAGVWCDNTDPYGRHGSNTLWGIRSFWDYQTEK